MDRLGELLPASELSSLFFLACVIIGPVGTGLSLEAHRQQFFFGDLAIGIESSGCTLTGGCTDFCAALNPRPITRKACQSRAPGR